MDKVGSAPAGSFLSQIRYLWPQAVLGRDHPGRQLLFLPSPCPARWFFCSALLWVRAVPAVPGAALWLGRAGGPTAPGPSVPSQNHPGLRHSFSSSFPGGRAPKATTIGAGTGPGQTHSCHWCWEGLGTAVPFPRGLGTVWGQLMVSARDRASSTTLEGLFLQQWLSCGHGMTRGSWGLQEPQGASPPVGQVLEPQVTAGHGQVPTHGGSALPCRDAVQALGLVRGGGGEIQLGIPSPRGCGSWGGSTGTSCDSRG